MSFEIDRDGRRIETQRDADGLLCNWRYAEDETCSGVMTCAFDNFPPGDDTPRSVHHSHRVDERGRIAQCWTIEFEAV